MTWVFGLKNNQYCLLFIMEKRIFYSQNKEDDMGSRQGRPKQEK